MSNKGQGNKKQQYKDLKKRAIDIDSIPSLTVVPNSIDVVDFAKARMAEISVLKKDIDDAKYRGARRVFQTLPKSMRRRAASFNIRRLPTRLRMKAIEEMEKDPASIQKKLKKPPCRRRNRRTKNIQEMSERRQKNKTWLETHIWHAKRSKMIDLWGFRLCLKPNEKCLRSSFKASKSGVTIHDASYHRVFEIQGSVKQCISFLENATCFTTYSDHFEFNLYSSENLRLICPVKATLHSTDDITIMWLFIHPSAGDQAFEDLKKRCDVAGIGISDISGQLNIFEFSGSETLQTLSKVLKPVEGEILLGEKVCHLIVEDPRFSFPPKEKILQHRSEAMVLDVDLARSIFNTELRKKCVELRKTDKQINDLKAELIIPGSSLEPTADDPCIPLLLLPFKSPLLLIPKHWARPFWRSFIFAKARFSGLEQIRRNKEELGESVFPYDFPGTMAYDQYATMVSEQRNADYLKKPKGKRINYDVLDIASPFKPNFHAESWIVPSKVLENLLSKSADFLALEKNSDLPLHINHALLVGEIVFTGKGSPDYCSIIYSQDGSKIIGYMTSGFFSLSKGCGAGLGACYAALLLPCMNYKGALCDQIVEVSARNTNSLVKRPATFRILGFN